MTDEPTKACVRVLKIESAWISLLKFIIITIPSKVGHVIFEAIEFIMKFINMCIVRSIMRWVGLPIAAYLFYLFIITDVRAEFELCMGTFALAVFFMCCTTVSWLYIPYQEQKILFKLREF